LIEEQAKGEAPSHRRDAANLQRDMDMAVEQMPEDRDETELGWYLCPSRRAVPPHGGSPAPQGLRAGAPEVARCFSASRIEKERRAQLRRSSERLVAKQISNCAKCLKRLNKIT